MYHKKVNVLVWPQWSRCTWKWPLPFWSPLQSSQGVHSSFACNQSTSAHSLCWPCRSHGYSLHWMSCGAALSPPPPLGNPSSWPMMLASLCLGCGHCNGLETYREDSDGPGGKTLESNATECKTKTILKGSPSRNLWHLWWQQLMASQVIHLKSLKPISQM